MSKLLIIGDSISLGYTPLVQEVLPCVTHANGNNHDTWHIIEKMPIWLGDNHYKIVHFNAGLWDIAHRIPGTLTLGDVDIYPITTTESEYAANIETIVRQLLPRADTILFATTTDVPANSIGRRSEDVDTYNAIAVQVMKDYGLRWDSLHALMLNHTDLHDVSGPNKVHYLPAGYQIMADHVVDVLNSHGGCS